MTRWHRILAAVFVFFGFLHSPATAANVTWVDILELGARAFQDLLLRERVENELERMRGRIADALEESSGDGVLLEVRYYGDERGNKILLDGGPRWIGVGASAEEVAAEYFRHDQLSVPVPDGLKRLDDSHMIWITKEDGRLQHSTIPSPFDVKTWEDGYQLYQHELRQEEEQRRREAARVVLRGGLQEITRLTGESRVFLALAEQATQRVREAEVRQRIAQIEEQRQFATEYSRLAAEALETARRESEMAKSRAEFQSVLSVFIGVLSTAGAILEIENTIGDVSAGEALVAADARLVQLEAASSRAQADAAGAQRQAAEALLRQQELEQILIDIYRSRTEVSSGDIPPDREFIVP